MEQCPYTDGKLLHYSESRCLKNLLIAQQKLTPQYIFGPKFWAFVLVAYLIQGTVCFFLWVNYRAVFKLRRAYFDSQEYKASLHSRSLLVGGRGASYNDHTNNKSAHTYSIRVPYRCGHRGTYRAGEANERHSTNCH
jgi:hypothetical protein